MRRKDREINDKILIEKIIMESEVCRVALNDGGYPYIVPMNHGYYADALYFHCAKTGKKIDLIRKDRRAAFEMEGSCKIIKADKACNWTAKYSSVIGRGNIEILEDIESIKSGLDVIMHHHQGPEGNYDNKYLKNMLILKLNIIEIKGKESK